MWLEEEAAEDEPDVASAEKEELEYLLQPATVELGRSQELVEAVRDEVRVRHGFSARMLLLLFVAIVLFTFCRVQLRRFRDLSIDEPVAHTAKLYLKMVIELGEVGVVASVDTPRRDIDTLLYVGSVIFHSHRCSIKCQRFAL